MNLTASTGPVFGLRGNGLARTGPAEPAPQWIAVVLHPQISRTIKDSSLRAWMGTPHMGCSRMRKKTEPISVILEFVRLGPLIRVSAIEPESLTEVVLQGPAAAGEAALRRAVLRKLAYVLRRRRSAPSR
jgi:hypothetical protein